jgi:hypothetical protein
MNVACGEGMDVCFSGDESILDCDGFSRGIDVQDGVVKWLDSQP